MDILDPEPGSSLRERSLSVSFRFQNAESDDSSSPKVSIPVLTQQSSRQSRRESANGGVDLPQVASTTSNLNDGPRLAFTMRDGPPMRGRRPSLYRTSVSDVNMHQTVSSLFTSGSRLDASSSTAVVNPISSTIINNMADDDGPDLIGNEDEFDDNVPIINRPWFKLMLRVFSLLSLLSAALNTPSTIYSLCWLNEAILGTDIFLALVFTLTMMAKMKYRGIFKGKIAYFQVWFNYIDFIALISIYSSIALQFWENSNPGKCVPPALRLDTGWSIVRSPRAMIMLRAGKVFVNKLNLPRELLRKIFRRSGKQLVFVSLFFVFFIATFAMVGTQIFSGLENHCIAPGSVSKFSLSDLAMPDQYCDPVFAARSIQNSSTSYSRPFYFVPESNTTSNESATACALSNSSDVVRSPASNAFGCPGDMTCASIGTKRTDRRLGTFQDLGHSLLTVYESSSQELWVFLMYANAEVVQGNSASYAFFMILIFLLSWLVENVFIAILIETFADMRAEVFVNLVSGPQTSTQVLRETDLGLQLVSLKGVGVESNLDKVRAFFLSHRFYNIVMVFVVADSIITALGTAKGVAHPILDRNTVVYPIEIFFTILFDLEVVAMMWCVGFRGYIRRKRFMIQFALAIGSSINLLPTLWYLRLDYLHIFQVLRLLRIIRASKSIEKFTDRILGGGTRLIVLLLITLLFIIAFALVSQHAFCYIHEVVEFSNFQRSFVSMFQMIMQEGWVELTSHIAQHAKYPYITSIYFIFFHLFASLYLLSTFVAVILDNLEYPESVKREKQLMYDKVQEEDGSALPLRLRLFRRFKPNPRIVRLNNMPVDFNQPLISETVMRTFIDSGETLRQDLEPNLPRHPLPDGFSQTESNSNHVFERTHSTRSGVSFQTITEVPLAHAHRRSGVEGNGSVESFVPRKASECATVQGHLVTHSSSSPCIDHAFMKSRTLHEVIVQRVTELRDQQASSEENGDLLFVPEGRASRIRRNQEDRQRRRLNEENKLREDYRFFDKVLFILDRDSGIRKFFQRIADARVPALFQDDAYHIFGYKRTLFQVLTSSTYLEWLMVVVTLYSTVSLVLEETQVRPPESTFHLVNDLVFVGTMTVEWIIKILGHGMLFTPNAVFGSAKSSLDLSIYWANIVYLCVLPKSAPSSELSAGVLVLLVMRCFRPLRLVTLIPQLRRVIFELFIGGKEGGKNSWQGKDIAYVTIIFFMFIYFFATYGTQLFSGILDRCNDITIGGQAGCIGEFEVPLTVSLHLFLNTTPPQILVPRVWRSPRLFDFDDIMSSSLALFEVITLEGWVDVRDVLQDQGSVFAAIYIHCYVFFGVLVGLTLFVGVIIFNFNKNSGTALLTVDQRRFYDLRSRLIIVQPNRFPPRPSHNPIRSYLFDLILSQNWKSFDILILLVNSSTLAIKWTYADVGTEIVMSISLACNCIFFVQTGIKIAALSLSGFFQSHRNAFEFALGVMGLSYIVLFGVAQSNPNNSKAMWEHARQVGIATVMLRFISLTGKGEIMKMLMLTVVQTVVKSSYIILCLIVFVLTYALIGNVLFSDVKYGEALGRHANFETPASALAMMIRIITGEDWNRLMRDAMVNVPDCISDEDCGSAPAAVFYFCSFYLMVAFVFLNLFIAVLLENFSLFYSSDEDALLSTKELQMFQAQWDVVDRNRSGEIPVQFVSFLVLLLEGALHVHLDLLEERMLFEQMFLEMQRHAEHAQRRTVKFQDVLGMLAYRSVDINTSLTLEEYIARKQLEDNIRLEVSRRIIRLWMRSRIKFVREQMEKGEQVLFSQIQAMGLSGKDGQDTARSSVANVYPDIVADVSQVRASSSEDTVSHFLFSGDSGGLLQSVSSISDDPSHRPLGKQRSSSIDEARSAVFNPDTVTGTVERTAHLNRWFDEYTSDEDFFDADFT